MVTVDNGSIQALGSMYIGYGSSANGTLNISNDSTVTVAGATYLGYNGASSAINFNGGTLTTGSLYYSTLDPLTGNGTVIAHGQVADGDLTLDSLTKTFYNGGVTVNLDMTNPAVNGDLGAGYQGAGTLEIQTSVTSANGYAGYSSNWSLTGAITVSNGATWTITGDLYAAKGDGSVGEITIGDGSSISIGGTLYLDSGYYATGTFTVSGGTATIGNCYIANNEGTGTLTINDNSLVNVTGALVVGNYMDGWGGGGSAYINQTGGTLNAASMTIGRFGAVTQSGGVANLTGNISGSGIYALSDGALNMNGNNISVASLSFSGGTITDAANISSSIVLGSSSSSSNMLQSRFQKLDSTGTGPVFQQSAGVTTTVSGAISGVGGLTKAGLGTLVLSGPLSYSGTTTIAAGTLKTAMASLMTLDSATTAVNMQSSTSKLVLNYTGYDQATVDGAIQAILKASYGDSSPHFASGFIYSSTAAANGNALGWTDKASTSEITVAYTVYGDANLDGAVNGADLGAVLANFGSTSGTWYMGDFNYDGSVNGADLGVVLANFGQHVSVTAAVPEPSTLLLLAAGLVSLLAYAWRKRK